MLQLLRNSVNTHASWSVSPLWPDYHVTLTLLRDSFNTHTLAKECRWLSPYSNLGFTFLILRCFREIHVHAPEMVSQEKFYASSITKYYLTTYMNTNMHMHPTKDCNIYD